MNSLLSGLRANHVRGGFVAASIAAAATVSAVSLTRIAGEKLGFPDGLEWTFTAATDIGAIGGAITWIVSPIGSRSRRTGMVSNIACTAVGAFFVGLDHAAAAPGWWAWAAFFVGAFLPLLSTWLVHDLVQSTAAPEKPVRRTPAAPKSTAAKPKTPAARTATPPKGIAAVPSPTQAWARSNWPCEAGELMAATQCSKATAYRVISKMREEKASEHAA